ncbi:hypothetical protein INT43_006989 [Umbelopsis isabellina]|uniref:BRCT domain-containing protein n=1 Tax=Mortierella isabellina TaxID=91625 RepID=A0A8H7UJG6_MORIS|nr:hypothetical protein INT43_006989 [Umbelopsis isabellina]
MPAIMKNLQPYPPLDILSQCVQKLRIIKTSRDEMLASCSFTDDKYGSISDGPRPKKPRISSNASRGSSKLSNIVNIDHITEAEERNPEIVLHSEIQASQEDDWSQTSLSKTVVLSRKKPTQDSRKSLERVIKIMYTGLTSSSEEEVERSLAKIAGTDMRIEVFEDSSWIPDEVTHVITHMDEHHLCKRTQKYLDAITKGKWVVGHRWLVESILVGRWVDERSYEVVGDLTNGVTAATSKGRFLKSTGGELFNGLRVYFQGDFQRSPSRHDLMLLARSAGARILQRRPADVQSNDNNSGVINVDRPLVVIEDIPTKWKKSQEWLTGYQVVSSNWMIETISRCSLQVPLP